MSDQATLTTAPPIRGTSGGSNLQPSDTSASIGLARVRPVTPAAATAVAVVRDGKTYYRRHRAPKPPKDSRIRKAVIAIVACKAQGFSWAEIAETLGLTKNTCMTYVKRAKRLGWLDMEHFDDPEDQLEYVIKHKVARNINKVMDETVIREVKRGEETVQVPTDIPTDRAVDVTMKVAAGTGLLKQHQVVKTDTQTNVGVALRVQVELPSNSAAGSLPTVRVGSIGGTPAVDATFTDEEN